MATVRRSLTSGGMLAACALAAVALAACGPAARSAGPTSSGVAGSAAAGALQMALYRNGALVRERRTVTLAEGQTELRLDGVAQRVVGGTMRLIDVTDEGDLRGDRVRAIGFDVLAANGGPAVGQRITVRREGEGEVTGKLVSTEAAGWVIVTDDPARPYVVVNPRSVVAIRGPFETVAGGGAVRWTLAPGAVGTHVVELSYVVADLRWDASYTLVLDTVGAQATLTGALAVENQTGVVFADAAVTLIDGDLPAIGVAVGAVGLGGGEPLLVGTFVGMLRPPNPEPQVTPPVVTPTAPDLAGERRVLLPHALTIRDTGRQVFTLVGERGVRIPAETKMVFDPVGKKLDSPTRVPMAQRSYGDIGGTEVYSSIELDLERAGIGAGTRVELPRGRVRLFQRAGDGALQPLGESEMFGDDLGQDGEDVDGHDDVAEGDVEPADGTDATAAASADGEPAPSPSDTSDTTKTAEAAAKAKAAKATKSSPSAGAAVRISVGRVPWVTGHRRQSDFDYDATGKRLVEEISVTLENTADTPARVVVREHLYRGQTWTLAYHSALSSAEKESAQQFRLPVTVPAHGQARVVYRVVYTW